MNTVISKQIMERFYSALDAIIAMKKIRGVNTYCRLNNIDRRNFYCAKEKTWSVDGFNYLGCILWLRSMG